MSGSETDIVLTVCRDEEDVIEAFIRFHLAMGFDAVYLVDNGSTDRTKSIVDSLVAERLPVVRREDHRTGYDLYLTEHYRWAGEHANARWLFFLDCDEYLYFPDGVKKYLGTLGDEVNLLRLLQRQMFQPTETPPEGPYGFLTTTMASVSFGDEPSKVISRFSPQAKVWGGKHRIDRPEPCEISPPEMFIRHYKYRSAGQARSKECNRVRSEAVFTDDDLRELSSFDLRATRDWIEESKALAAAEEWRKWFSPDQPTTVDDVLLRWVDGEAPIPVEPHPVPGERLLLHEILRRVCAAVLRIDLRGGSEQLRERIGSGPGTVLAGCPDADGVDADGLVLAGEMSPEEIAALAGQGDRWTLVNAPHPHQDRLIDLARGRGLQVAYFGEDYYGRAVFDRAQVPAGSGLLGITRHDRAENGVLARRDIPAESGEAR